ncbi:cyclase [Hathewaya proteolytica DSM 3090]|uniref:Imidazole glycerol phosphate synthase subunit HisF n=1 Tax=Hathewaya proteolytica DSM 3090 TaxID=1121331 RepID=A0A1M6RGJ2_9CLOT|nr:imidazole glycerol phosphate synthase subunit HisF [Hathewaya proteolytica]SHK31585.1 cyclase [Hathewaya proteolytica DSM 3090]
MHTKRIIPCLDVKDGKVVKGVNFQVLKQVGDPVELAKSYYEQGADELVFLDISATNEGRGTMVNVVESISKEIFIPFTVGGGIKTLDNIKQLLRAGADKISLNSAAIKDKSLIAKGARIFGSQCIALAVDAKRNGRGGFNVYINGGLVDTGLELVDWVKEGVGLGAGEILLTSMDGDGTKHGFDCEMYRAIKDKVNVPIIASGGCGIVEDFYEVFKDELCDAALAASIFHYGEATVGDVKKYLNNKNIDVRL